MGERALSALARSRPAGCSRRGAASRRCCWRGWVAAAPWGRRTALAAPTAAAAVVAAAALFERQLPAAGAGMGGWGAAAAVYEQALAAAPLEVRAHPQPRLSAPPASGLSALRPPAVTARARRHAVRLAEGSASLLFARSRRA